MDEPVSSDTPPPQTGPPLSTVIRRSSFTYRSDTFEPLTKIPLPSSEHLDAIPTANEPGNPAPFESISPTPDDTPLTTSVSRNSYPFPAPPALVNEHEHEHEYEHEYPPISAPAGLNTPGTDSEQPFFISALPPVDGGYAAWSFLAAGTILEALIWGLPFSVGVLHEYWTSTLFDGRGESSLTLAAALLNGMLYMGAVVFGPLNTAFPRWTKVMQIIGLAAGSISLVASAFVTEPWHLIVTLGCLYPIAGACYYPCITLLFEWFHAKRGLATGVMFGGTGGGGAIFPFIVHGLLKAFGYKATMIALGVGMAIVGGVTLVFIKRRIPLARADLPESDRRRTNIDWSFLKNRFLFASLAVVLAVSLGNFIPSLWLPTFAKELNVTKPDGIALIAIMNACAVPGNLIMGYMTDRLPFYMVIVSSCLGAAFSCLFLWGFGTTDVVLVIFVLTYGLLGMTSCSLWGKMVSLIAGDDITLPPLLVCALTFTRGIGSFTSGPISDALLKINVLNGSVGAYGHHNYGILLIYTGATILTGGAFGMMFKT